MICPFNLRRQVEGMSLMEYYCPSSLKEAKELIRVKKTKLLAGGTDLILQLQKNKINCEALVNLEKLKELRGITEGKGGVTVGAMVTFEEMLENSVIKEHFSALHISCSTMGSPQIRNMATIGGNIINAGSAADAIPCIIALGGLLVIESSEMIRVISCEEYFHKYDNEKIKDNEILTKIILPKEGYCSGFYKLGKRNSLAIARISVAVAIKVEDKIIQDIRVCLGAVGRYALRPFEFEELSKGKEVLWLSSEEALLYLERKVADSIGGRKTMPFKREAVKGVFKEALAEALKD